MSTSKSRNYVFTRNNPDQEFEQHLDQLACRYIVYGREIAPTTGTPHLQGFVVWRSPRSINGCRTALPGCHVERANGTPLQCSVYCKKDGDFVERGEHPLSPTECGDKEKARWANAYVLAREGRIDEIDPDILIRHLGNLQRIADDNLGVSSGLANTCGLWLVGESGCGKSKGARERFPSAYPKPLNKWWDGYRDQKSVLIDDVDRSHAQWLGTFLKIWADHYPYIAEKKGRSVEVRPDRIIVTSQYEIGDIFGGDQPLVVALERRFRRLEVFANNQIEWLDSDRETEGDVEGANGGGGDS